MAALWVRCIKENLCIDIIRRQRTVAKHNDGVVAWTKRYQYSPSPEAEAILGERANLLEHALAKLKPDYRQVILLRCVHSLSAKETAAVLKIKASQVDSMLAYAKKLLKNQLAELQTQSQT